MGVPERIIVNLHITLDPASVPELAKGFKDENMSLEEMRATLTEWAEEFKRDLEQADGITVAYTVEGAI